MHRFSLEKKGGWIPDSPAIISTSLHLTVAGTMQHITNGVLPVNATWSFSASKGEKIVSAALALFHHQHSAKMLPESTMHERWLYQHFTQMPRLIYHQLGSVWK